MRTDELLEAIEHTLADKRLSPDAMSWTSAPARRAGREPVYYMATGQDGIIPASELAGVPVSLADAVGQTLEHPTPCENLWFTETRFSYFEAVKAPGEALDGLSWLWPIRLWIVEPMGITGNWGGRYYNYRLLSHRLRVIKEVDAALALGPRGRQVLDLLPRIPDLAQEWAAAFDADPDAMRERERHWELCGSDTSLRSRMAGAIATSAARRRRRTAALTKIGKMAGDLAHDAVPHTSSSAQSYAWRRGANLATATLLEDALDPGALAALRGEDLDRQPALPCKWG